MSKPPCGRGHDRRQPPAHRRVLDHLCEALSHSRPWEVYSSCQRIKSPTMIIGAGNITIAPSPRRPPWQNRSTTTSVVPDEAYLESPGGSHSTPVAPSETTGAQSPSGPRRRSVRQRPFGLICPQHEPRLHRPHWSHRWEDAPFVHEHHDGMEDLMDLISQHCLIPPRAVRNARLTIRLCAGP